MSLLKEIFEQPQVMHRLVTEQWDHTVDIAQQLQRRGFRYVFLAAQWYIG
jgi:tRNA isopentenyl-2-thiomethyl-A-37 hydroxylase MiaE